FQEFGVLERKIPGLFRICAQIVQLGLGCLDELPATRPQADQRRPSKFEPRAVGFAEYSRFEAPTGIAFISVHRVSRVLRVCRDHLIALVAGARRLTWIGPVDWAEIGSCGSAGHRGWRRNSQEIENRGSH